MGLTTLRADVHSLVLNARRLERVIGTPEFEALYSTLSVEDKAYVIRWVKDLQIDQLVKFIQTKAEKEVGEMSVRQLRTKAAALYISGYSLMSKESLIRAIVTEQARIRVRSGSPPRVEGDSGVVFEQGQTRDERAGNMQQVAC